MYIETRGEDEEERGRDEKEEAGKKTFLFFLYIFPLLLLIFCF